ncbi:MAG: 3-phosphoserine/phosphohydroxythreonine transaminase [Candidatus Hydrogenedentes bacterium]|nr:3-phosphoserine/phosphohydroxythreonine transaminase [Candidatus Hydrogenedentota bacterium]
MTDIYNFNAGPAILPKAVLAQARDEMLDYGGSGISILESSHRGKEYIAVQEEAGRNLRALLGISDDYAVLFLQGGASHQFAMVPMNLLGEGQVADYAHSGAWAKKAIAEAKRIGAVHIAADCADDRPARVPDPDALDCSTDAAYLHITSNETISGAQWKRFPQTDAPLVADMSSDILSRAIDVSQFGIIYAGAQKNLGPSGVTIVIIRKDLAERVSDSVPAILQYATHIKNDSMFNTPPCFSVYLVMLVTRWLEAQGGVGAMQAINEEKAAKLYGAIDATEFYTGTAAPECRSTMNVTFRLPSEELEAAFVKAATQQGMQGLKGHRSVGGIRASIYNAFPATGVDTLTGFMRDFEQKNG